MASHRTSVHAARRLNTEERFRRQVHLKGRRSVRRRLAILFATALLSTFGAAACGAGVEEQVEQQVQEQVQEGQEVCKVLPSSEMFEELSTAPKGKDRFHRQDM